MTFYLGIDGGGSKTTCAVGDDSSLLATATAGPSNITRVGEVRAREALHHAIREACAAANVDPNQVKRACIGAAGAGREEVAAAIRKIAAEIIPGEIEVVGDMQIAMAAAFGEGPGVIVIAGTGSIAYGRNAQGKTARAGGWGFAISDEGSAHWIGRAAVTAVLRAIDQQIGRDADQFISQEAPRTLPLFARLISTWNVRSFDEFVRMANSSPDFAVLFPAIAAAAEDQDKIAQSVLIEAGRELAKLAEIVARQLFPTDSTAESPLAMVGGVFRHSRHVREVFCAEIGKIKPHMDLNGEVIDPVAGALQMAQTDTHRPPPTSRIAPVV